MLLGKEEHGAAATGMLDPGGSWGGLQALHRAGELVWKGNGALVSLFWRLLYVFVVCMSLVTSQCGRREIGTHSVSAMVCSKGYQVLE